MTVPVNPRILARTETSMLGGTPDARRGAVGSGAGATAISQQQRAGERLPANRGVSCEPVRPSTSAMGRTRRRLHLPGAAERLVCFTPELDGGAR